MRKVAGGLTVLPDAKGSWTDPDGQRTYENMTPVLIRCNEDQFEIILDFTLKYYQQREVFAFRLAHEKNVITWKAPDNVVEFKK